MKYDGQETFGLHTSAGASVALDGRVLDVIRRAYSCRYIGERCFTAMWRDYTPPTAAQPVVQILWWQQEFRSVCWSLRIFPKLEI